MGTWLNGKYLEEPKNSLGMKPSEVAAMPAQQRAAVRIALDAELDPDCRVWDSERDFEMRKALGREGAALSKEQREQDQDDYSKADPATLVASHVARVNELSSLLKERGFFAHKEGV